MEMEIWCVSDWEGGKERRQEWFLPLYLQPWPLPQRWNCQIYPASSGHLTWLAMATPVSTCPILDKSFPHHFPRHVYPHLLPICLLVTIDSWAPLFIYFHIYHLTSPTNFRFELLFSKTITLALVFITSVLFSLSLVSCLLSHKLNIFIMWIWPSHHSS